MKGQSYMLQAGSAFPNFSLPNQDGKTVKLSDFRGKWLVVYFYPKDDTPGCTIQAKAFTATKADFDRENVAVIGVSQDDVTSHKNFCNKFAFTIDLLADTGGELMRACGLAQSEWQGLKFWERTSFVIDPNGTVRKVYPKVDPQGHEQVLLDDVKKLQKDAAVRA
jgi:thioredoxin-dependent peroxiredoxin